MKKMNLIIAAVLILGLIGVFASFKTDQKSTTEYMTIFVQGFEKYNVFVSINGQEYKEINTPSEGKDKGKFNYNPVLRLISDYEKEGWAIVNNNITVSPNGNPYNYYLLKRIK
jgi:hypothetical protein